MLSYAYVGFVSLCCLYVLVDFGLLCVCDLRMSCGFLVVGLSGFVCLVWVGLVVCFDAGVLLLLLVCIFRWRYSLGAVVRDFCLDV